MNKDLLLGFLAGVAVVLGGLLVHQSLTTPVHAQMAGSVGEVLTVTGKDPSSNASLVYTVDTNARKLSVYKNASGSFNLQDQRTIKYDLMLDFLRNQRPSVRAVRRAVKKFKVQ